MLDETVVRVNDGPFFLYVVVDPATNHIPHIRLFPRPMTATTDILLRELCQQHDVSGRTFLSTERRDCRPRPIATACNSATKSMVIGPSSNVFTTG